MSTLGPITARIAEHVSGVTFEQLPPSTVHAARRALLDASGVMLAASGLSTDAWPFLEFARAQGGVAESTIIGTGARVPAALAAFANGALSHALDFEDAFDRAPVHPNAASIPALLALAEARAPTSGAELLTSIVVGCDLACRLGLALGQALEAAGWYPPPILGAFGATAATSRLLRLDRRQIADALSLLLLQNSAPGQIKHATDGVVRAVREAVPAQAAVQSAMLAALGVRGFDAPFEGPGGLFETFARGDADLRPLLDGLGERWLIEELSFKPWPSCRGTHAAIELALQLRAQAGVVLDDVVDIIVGGGPVQAMLAEPLERKRAPPTAIEAKFSLPFTIATALVHGVVDLDPLRCGGAARPRRSRGGVARALRASRGLGPGASHLGHPASAAARRPRSRSRAHRSARLTGSPSRRCGADRQVRDVRGAGGPTGRRHAGTGDRRAHPEYGRRRRCIAPP